MNFTVRVPYVLACLVGSFTLFCTSAALERERNARADGEGGGSGCNCPAPTFTKIAEGSVGPGVTATPPLDVAQYREIVVYTTAATVGGNPGNCSRAEGIDFAADDKSFYAPTTPATEVNEPRLGRLRVDGRFAKVSFHLFSQGGAPTCTGKVDWIVAGIK